MKHFTLFLILFLCVCTCTNERKQGDKKMAYIPGGSFTSVNNQDTLEMMVKPFYIDKSEVTVAEFEKFVQATGFVTDAEKEEGKSEVLPGEKVIVISGINWRYDEIGKLRKSEKYNFPVIHISYNDAAAYAAWSGKRLPQHYELEFAEREGRKPGYRGFISRTAWYDRNSGYKIHPCMAKAANSYGVYDLFGNVYEYVQISTDTASGQVGLKGGAYWIDKSLIKSEVTVLANPSSRSFYSGFRCVSDISQ
jgi:sulfatase modifying factor 1